MALVVHIIPTGDSIQPSSQAPTSIEALKSWIARETGIAEGDQIVLTGKGKHVQAQTLLTENEFYLFDRELFASNSQATIPAEPLPEPWTPDDFPTDLKSTDSLKAWQNLFKSRQRWSTSLLQSCTAICEDCEIYISKRRIIESGLRVATQKHGAFIADLEKRHADTRAWFEDVKRDANGSIATLEGDVGRLETVPVLAGFGKFFGQQELGLQRRRSSLSSTTGLNLASFIDRATADKAVENARAALEASDKRLQELRAKLDTIASEHEALMRDLGTSQTRSLRDDPEEPRKQLQEIQVLSKKVADDYEHAMTLQETPANLRQLSKTALLHTKSFLPNLRDCAQDLDELLRYLIDAKNSFSQRALDHLQTVARVESSIPGLRKAFDNFSISEEGLAALDQLSQTSQLPITYGSLLIEAAKRREWIEKMKHDSSLLQEEIAGYQAEEEKRRKKWARGVAELLGDNVKEGKVLSVEVNLQGEEFGWPSVTRQDVEEYTQRLRQIPGFEAVVESLSQTLKSMDQPTRQQVKRAKAFKMGSVHEATSGFGKGSLMLRGDDEAKVLRDANLKLEDEAKGYKSRIRKLEDLLHRQQMFQRLSIPNSGSQSSPFSEHQAPGTPVEPVAPLSPRQAAVELHSRRSSNSSRRVSFNNQNQDEKTLARRIVQLEADLVAARDAQKKQEKTHSAALEEANSTKNDLMENMEAQQREFATERRALLDELARHKERMEEMEDEYERLSGSREGVEARIQVLMVERDEARKEQAEKIKLTQARTKSLEHELRNHAEKEVERVDLLKGLHNTLDAGNMPPEEPSLLIAAIEDLVRRTQDQHSELAQAIALAKSENENLQSLLDAQKAETIRLEEEMEAKVTAMKKVQDELRTEQSKAAAIATELENERKQLKDLREKFAEGETGSESLRQRLAEAEEKLGKKMTELAKERSHINSLDVELMSINSKYHKLQEMHEEAEKRLQDKSARAKTVSQRLYTHNDRLMRLLGALGFAIAFEDGVMKLERASKAAGAASMITDTGTIGAGSLHRTISGSTTTRWIEDLADVSLLLWPEKDLPQDEEAKFNEYMDRISRFNLDVFADAITKRMRDMEHTARKWQREARNHRDKAHKLQSEAHDKIAFRSFKDGDLALFLPTRNQAMKPWAAFNIGAPHYFLREQDSHKLVNRDWLVARISKIEERIVDLSRNMHRSTGADDGKSMTEASDAGNSYEDDNPFDLSDGLRWYLIDAQEEKIGAPTTPGLGKAIVSTSTVSATRDDSKASASRAIGIKKKPTDAVEEASKALSRSLDSRRSSHSSKKGVPVSGAGLGINTGVGSPASGTSITNNGLLSPDVNSAQAEPPFAVRNGPGPSHLRTASDVASMLKSTDELKGGEGIQDQHNPLSPTSQPTISAPKPGSSLDALRRNASHASVNSAGSPIKPSPAKKSGGVWDSLFQYEISLQGGKKKS